MLAHPPSSLDVPLGWSYGPARYNNIHPKGHAMAAKRTTHRSSKGTKLYAVRNAKGQFKDIQTYKRAHSQDVKRKSRGE